MTAVCVIGAGSWGTGIVALLGAARAARIQWYCRDPEQALAINRDGANPSHFPESALPASTYATSDLSEALSGCAVAYLVVPAAGVREVIDGHRGAWELWQDVAIAGGNTDSEGAGSNPRPAANDSQGRGLGPAPSSSFPIVVNCSKGLLADPTERADEWLAAALPRAQLVRLSGPNIAAEIVAGQPAAAVAASQSAQAAERVQRQLASERFRVYSAGDLVGVEVAGFYKNIIAIAAGIAHGLGLGGNTRAVLITRGLAEMGRVAAHLGGDPATLHGLAGAGDLIVTCSSPLSRNFQVGMRRAGGESLREIEAAMSETAEGVNTSRALWQLPGVAALDLPIAQQVYRVLHEGLDPREAIAQLMHRPLKGE